MSHIKSEASSYDHPIRHRYDTSNSNESYNGINTGMEENLRRTALTSMRETLLQKKSRIPSESEARGLDRYELDRYNRENHGNNLDEKYNDYTPASSSKRSKNSDRDLYREDDYYDDYHSESRRSRSHRREREEREEYYDYPQRSRDRYRERGDDYDYDMRGDSRRDRSRERIKDDTDLDKELRRLKEEDRQAKRLRELERERDLLERKLQEEKAKKRRREETGRSARRHSRSRSRSLRSRSRRDRDREYYHSRSRSRTPPRRRGRRERRRERRLQKRERNLRNRLSDEWNRGDIETKVYIGNLGDQPPTKSELEEEFSEFGTVIRSWLARDPPGFARVEFKYPEDAKKAIRTLHGKMYNGRSLVVERQRELRPRRGRKGRSRSTSPRRNSRRDVHSRSNSPREKRRRKTRAERRADKDERLRNKDSQTSTKNSKSSERDYDSGSDSEYNKKKRRRRDRYYDDSRSNSRSSSFDSYNSDFTDWRDVALPKSPGVIDDTIKQEPIEFGCQRPPTIKEENTEESLNGEILSLDGKMEDENMSEINNSEKQEEQKLIIDSVMKQEPEFIDIKDITKSQISEKEETNDNSIKEENINNVEPELESEDNESYETDSFAKSDSQSEHEHIEAYNMQQQRILRSSSSSNNNNTNNNVVGSIPSSNSQVEDNSETGNGNEFLADETNELTYGYGY